MQTHIPQVVQLTLRAADLLGYQHRIIDPDYCYLFEVSNGRESRCFVGGVSPLNDALAFRLAQDKYYTSVVLAHYGFRVPECVRCLRANHFTVNDFSDREGMLPGIEFARSNGYPLIVKPNRMALGRDVVAVNNEYELVAAIETVWKGDYIALVQRLITGWDVRFDLLNGSMIAGYRRSPITIVGDGLNTIRSLLAEVDRRFADDAFFRHRAAEATWQSNVTSHGWDEKTVLSRGESVSFESAVLNLNRWATAELIRELPSKWLDFCLSAADVMKLHHFGLDLRIPIEHGSWMDESPHSSVIIEINASPSLAQFHDLGYPDEALEAQAAVLRAAFATNT